MRLLCISYWGCLLTAAHSHVTSGVLMRVRTYDTIVDCPW